MWRPQKASNVTNPHIEDLQEKERERERETERERQREKERKRERRAGKRILMSIKALPLTTI
jgi:hypothetical protein